MVLAFVSAVRLAFTTCPVLPPAPAYAVCASTLVIIVAILLNAASVFAAVPTTVFANAVF